MASDLNGGGAGRASFTHVVARASVHHLSGRHMSLPFHSPRRRSEQDDKKWPPGSHSRRPEQPSAVEPETGPERMGLSISCCQGCPACSRSSAVRGARPYGRRIRTIIGVIREEGFLSHECPRGRPWAGRRPMGGCHDAPRARFTALDARQANDVKSKNLQKEHRDRKKDGRVRQRKREPGDLLPGPHADRPQGEPGLVAESAGSPGAPPALTSVQSTG